ncbi:histidinol-phosphate transaminase [Alistipes finegoldii]|uniref:histidinol-phosphate transaminase n=1 Tax=Alistipes finegoldii TaxID=214856 RepID=UPI003AF13F55
MKPLAQLVRPNILALQPYSTARDEYAGGGIGVWLDANESPYDNGVNRYPDPHQRELKAQLAALKGVRSGQIFLGNGSDEAIDLAFRIFCEPGRDNAVSIAPTYGMYRVAAQTNDVELREVPLGADFSLPVEALLAAADGRTKLLWLCSPNNPTGNAFPDREIEELLRRFDGVVVLDEAYIDFAEGRGFLPRLDEFPNLIVLQTLSKAWGMAGLRLGLAFASERIAALFGQVKYPYNINTLTQQTAAECLRRNIAAQVAQIREERGRLAAALAGCGCIEQVYPSQANFLLVKTADPDRLYGELIAAGVIVRNRTRIAGCEGCLRITVGTPAENGRMLETVKNFRP